MKRAAVPSILVAVVLLVLGVKAEAQQPTKVPRIGYLSNTDAATDSARAEGIRLALRELGYIEGQNIAIEYRYAEGRRDREPGLAAELVRLKVDIIVVASGDVTIQAAKNATKTIPIVMMGLGSDPVKAGHVESLARPGGNVTGVTNLTRELGGKRLARRKRVRGRLTKKRLKVPRALLSMSAVGQARHLWKNRIVLRLSVKENGTNPMVERAA